MASTGHIHLIRHGEAKHNLLQSDGKPNFQQHDPSLTEKGIQQALALCDEFPHLDTTAVVLVSPLIRTLQTALLAFPKLLDKKYYAKGFHGYDRLSGKQEWWDMDSEGIELVVKPELQERGGVICDVGNDTRVLQEYFPGVDFSALSHDWHHKHGIYSAHCETVKMRAAHVRKELLKMLRELEKSGSERRNVVVVSHGGFIRSLTGNEGAEWGNCAWRSFRLVERGDDVIMEEVVREGGDIE